MLQVCVHDVIAWKILFFLFRFHCAMCLNWTSWLASLLLYNQTGQSRLDVVCLLFTRVSDTWLWLMYGSHGRHEKGEGQDAHDPLRFKWLGYLGTMPETIFCCQKHQKIFCLRCTKWNMCTYSCIRLAIVPPPRTFPVDAHVCGPDKCKS